jgi:hypothetical protein
MGSVRLNRLQRGRVLEMPLSDIAHAAAAWLMAAAGTFNKLATISGGSYCIV